jgi:hypothetical protein
VAEELSALWEEACGFYAAALARSTVVQYDGHVKKFATFCVATKYNFSAPTEYHVMMYVTLLARSLAPGSVRQYLKDLKAHYRARGYCVFGDPVEWPSLYATLKGIDRVKKKGDNKKCPITPAMLMKFRDNCGRDTKAGAALFACALVTFFGYFRKSNTTSAAGAANAVGKCIRVCDVEVLVSPNYCLKISVQESKNRQFTKGPVVYIAGYEGHPLDAVAAWRAHMALNTLGSTFHAFAFKVGSGTVAMHHSKLVEAAKSMAKLVGMDPTLVAGHSFRRGGASFAFQSGVSDVLIQRQGDWASLCYREYITLSPESALRATRLMFRALPFPGFAETWGSSIVPSDSPAGHVGLADSIE